MSTAGRAAVTCALTDADVLPRWQHEAEPEDAGWGGFLPALQAHGEQ